MKMSLLLIIYFLTLTTSAFCQSVDYVASESSHLSTENPNVGKNGKEG
jgi:hypothetical protein